MRGNSFGKIFSITTFGESHGPAIGVIVDGMIANVQMSEKDLQLALDRRAPGKNKGTSSRKESDKFEILSGVFDGKTLGTPICVIVRNTDQKSSDYDHLKKNYRVGHADKTTEMKYGIRDHRGGGRSSGRETIARVIGGYFAGIILDRDKTLNIKSAILNLGDFDCTKNSDSSMYDYLEQLQSDGESVGGKIQVVVENCPPSLGEPCFDKIKADLAKALLSIGGCTSFSYGLGEDFANSKGSEVVMDQDNFGGIEGGITNGRKIVLSLTFKPTSTVGENAKNGRHDPSIIPRAIPVVEAMIKIVLADHLLRQKAYSF